MASREISVIMESRYKSNLSAELRRDKRKIDAFQAYLKRRPLSVPIRLDLRDAVTQAAAMRKTILGEFAKIQPTILGSDGRPATATATATPMGRKAGVLSTTEIQRRNKDGELMLEEIQMTEQLGKGIQQVNKFKAEGGKIDDDPYQTTTRRTTKEVENLKDALRGMNEEMRAGYAGARGRGDKASQIQYLTEQRARLNAALQEAAKNGLTFSKDYQRGEQQVASLSDRIANLQGRQETDAQKKTRKDRSREIANEITMEERRVQEALKANKMQMDAAERIPDRAAREAEINRLYDERQKLFQQSRDKFRAMDAALQGEDRPDLADRAMRRGLGMDNQANQAALDKQRAETDRMRAAAKEQERIDKENTRRAEKAKRLADQAAAKSGTRNFGRQMRLDEFATKQAIIRNDAELAAAKAIPDRAAREAEVNRILSERSRIYQDQARRMEQVQRAQAGAGDPDKAAKAEAAKLKAQQNAANVGVDQTKADAAAQIASQKEAEAAKKKADADARAQRESAFKQEMQDIKTRSDKRIAQINANERKERAAAKTADERAAASKKAHSLRQSEYGNLAGAYAGLEGRARAAGHVGAADAARGKRLGAEVSGERDMVKFASATNRSGHALNFHSSALLRNAATFARWMIPVQAVLGMVRAFNAGFAGAMQVDKQFATLRAVFRGTDEEAQKLKKDTLDLAAAQGRSADEAMDAAIRWSRLGLNRQQVNLAVKTSLMAANVAEMKSAETAEKLSAIYATYRLNVGDLPVVLSRLNAISNRYNVTNKDLLEGLVRVTGVAKTAGMELRDLEGIIGAVTGATGRPGQEVGNALKFVITRLGSPDTMKALKESFNLDLTGPNGDLKNMSQIFRELADIFPTLNNAQKQYFLKVTAGSRQAARFALILDQYRQAQILAAEAGFDTASAFQENQKILESLQSRVDSLKASWVSLFTAMGDAGVFEFLGRRVRFLQAIVQGFGDTLTEMEKAQGVTINDPRYAESVERAGGRGNTMFGTRSVFSKEEIENTIREAEEALNAQLGRIKSQKQGGAKGAASKARDFAENGTSDINAGNRNEENSFKWMDGKGEFQNVEEAKQFIDYLKQLLKLGSETGAVDEITAMTAEVNALRERLGSLERAAGVFESLGNGIANGSTDRDTMIRDFEASAHLLLNMEDGATKYGDAIKRFYAMLESGDTAGILKLIEELRLLFSGDVDATRGKLTAATKPAVDALRAKRVDLEKQRRDLLSQPVPESEDGQRLRKERVEQLQGDIKAVQGAIEQLTQAAERFEKTAFGFKSMQGINQYLDDVLKAAELVKDAFKDFAPDAANDPVDRIFQRQRNTLQTGRDYLAEIKNQTNAESEKRRAEAQTKIKQATDAAFEGQEDLEILEHKRRTHRETPYLKENEEDLAKWQARNTEEGISKLAEDYGVTKDEARAIIEQRIKDEQRSVDVGREAIEKDIPSSSLDAKRAEIEAAKKVIEEQKLILEQQDEADQLAASRLQQEEEKIRALERELEIQEQIANIQRAATDAGRVAADSSLAWRFGETESDKDANQAAAAIKRARAGLADAGGDWLLGQDTPMSRAQDHGQVLQDEATARGALESMERRQYELEAARKQVAFDTVKAMKEQTEEASKRLMLASREDQLRAAALARTIRDKGPIGDNEFFALSQESRQAMTNYLPNQAPDILNDAKRDAAKSYQEIDEERGRLSSTIGDLRGALDKLAKDITTATGKGGPLDIAPPAPAQPLQDAADKGARDKSPLININLGDIAVSIALSGEVNRLLTDYVDRRFKSELTALETRLKGTPIPSAYGAIE